MSQQRRRDSEHHRADLRRARLSALRRLRRRFAVLGAGGGVAVALAGALGLAVVRPQVAAAPEPVPPGARSAPLEELWVRGAVHILDEEGRELAILGRERGSGPIVLGLHSPVAGAESQQTLRLATSETGSAVSVRTPDGASSVTVFAAETGPELELRQGSARRLLSEQAPLPAVGADRDPAPQVDLAVPDVQDIGDGFLAAQLAAAESAGGIRLTGRIINASSLVHRKLDLRVTLGDRSTRFGIPLISPGNSTGFDVTVPGVELAEVGVARIEYLASTVTYSGHWARGYQGRLSSRR